jgi:hypothetical protein
MVIAKAGLIGNCLRLKSKGSLESEGINDIRGIKTLLPIKSPDAISALITLSPKALINNLVPLNEPFFEDIFLSNIIG